MSTITSARALSAAGGVVAFLIGVSACSSTGTTPATITKTITASPSPAQTGDARFLQELERHGIDTTDEENLIGIGKSACRLMDTGVSYDRTWNILGNQGRFTLTEALGIAYSATVAYCPDHTPSR